MVSNRSNNIHNIFWTSFNLIDEIVLDFDCFRSDFIETSLSLNVSSATSHFKSGLAAD